MKIAGKAQNMRFTNLQCSLANGPYKSVFFAPLTRQERAGDCISYLVNSKAFSVCCKSGNIYSVRSAKKGIHLLLVDGDGLSNQETAYASRYCDITVLCSERCIEEAEALDAMCVNTSRVVICYASREHSRETRQVLGRDYADIKVIDRETLVDTLTRLQVLDAHSRPIIMPWRYTFHNDGGLVCEVFLSSGLVSKSFVCNGLYDLELAEISVDGISHTKDIFLPNENVSYAYSSVHEGSGDENTSVCVAACDEVNVSDNTDSAHEKYQSLKDICDAEVKVSTAYRHLAFLTNYRTVEGQCLKRHNRFFKGKRAILRFKPHIDVCSGTKFVVLANMFCIEAQNTVYNIYFSSKMEIRQGMYLRADNGVRMFDFAPLLSENGSRAVFSVRRSMHTGVMTFIGPLTICTGRINIYNAVESHETSGNNYICHGSLIKFGDRTLVEEKRLTGEPYKIHKRLCVIRNMFSNKDDVVRFINYGLRAEGNNEGIIKEPVGTHGMFKAYFSRPVKHGEQIVLSMYRRVFPALVMPSIVCGAQSELHC